MMKWIDRFAVWYARLPSWAALLLFPVVAPAMLAYSTIALVVLLVFVLPYLLVFGSKTQAQSPAAKFSLAEVREHAESLNRWFDDALANHTVSADCLGMGPELARELVRLAGQPGLTREATAQFAERVQLELKGYKGSPFFALHHLSRRLMELSDNDRAAVEAARADRPRD